MEDSQTDGISSIIPDSSGFRFGSDATVSSESGADPSSEQDVGVRRISYPEKPNRFMSRRGFLRAAVGVGALGISAYFGVRFWNNSNKSVESIVPAASEKVGGDYVENYRKKIGFNEAAARAWMEEKKIPGEDYGKIAAAGVSFLSLTSGDEGYVASDGTGGVAEIEGVKYLVTTMHVLDQYFLAKAKRDSQKDPMLLVNVPGTKSMYRLNPGSFYTYNPQPTPDYDGPVFIQIEGELEKEVEMLIQRNQLTPLHPMQYSNSTTPSISQLRFQGGEMGLHDYKYATHDTKSITDRYSFEESSESPVFCAGNSGSVALSKDEDGRLTGEFYGVFTHTSERRLSDGQRETFQPDAYQAMGDTATCSISVKMTSFGDSFFAQGYLRKTQI